MMMSNLYDVQLVVVCDCDCGYVHGYDYDCVNDYESVLLYEQLVEEVYPVCFPVDANFPEYGPQVVLDVLCKHEKVIDYYTYKSNKKIIVLIRFLIKWEVQTTIQEY